LRPSKTTIRVASGRKIVPIGHWWGDVQVGGVRVSAWFEVFDCGGAFNVILGKLWLYAVRATHNYDGDRIHIRSADSEAVICNGEGKTMVEEPETEEEMRENEVARLARKTAKERKQKQAQLERRAEQPLPYPGLGYSPPVWTAPIPRSP
jgi:hypothetical protein